MNMRTIPEMITGLRALANSPEALISHAALLDDAANYIEGATESLRQHMKMLQEMRVRLEQVRPLMEEAASVLEDVMIKGCDEEELPAAIRAMLRWWEPGTEEPVSISHWGIVE
jgi:DNA-binding response OmpR family regulator